MTLSGIGIQVTIFKLIVREVDSRFLPIVSGEFLNQEVCFSPARATMGIADIRVRVAMISLFIAELVTICVVHPIVFHFMIVAVTIAVLLI